LKRIKIKIGYQSDTKQLSANTKRALTLLENEGIIFHWNTQVLGGNDKNNGLFITIKNVDVSITEIK
jgi:hypothetical protein